MYYAHTVKDPQTLKRRAGIDVSSIGGAGDRDRTGTGLVDPRDFKSLASAYSATPARVADFNIAPMAHSHFYLGHSLRPTRQFF